MTPGRNCSTTTSAVLARSRMRSRALGSFKSAATLFLPRLSMAKLTLSLPHSGAKRRISSPSGRSNLITSAPASASIRVARGPGSSVEKSRTRIPASGPFVVVVMPSLPCERSLSGLYRPDRRPADENESFPCSDNLLGCGNAGAIGAVRRRIVVLRAGLAGKEQPIVDSRGKHGAAVRLSRHGIGIGAARKGVGTPLMNADRLEALGEIVAENAR